MSVGGSSTCMVLLQGSWQTPFIMPLGIVARFSILPSFNQGTEESEICERRCAANCGFLLLSRVLEARHHPLRIPNSLPRQRKKSSPYSLDQHPTQ